MSSLVIVDTRLPKLCIMKPGDVIEIHPNGGHSCEPGIYLVCVFEVKGKRAARPLMSHGLYDDERPMFLVNLRTGAAVPMPHLSSRVEPIRDARIIIGGEPS